MAEDSSKLKKMKTLYDRFQDVKKRAALVKAEATAILEELENAGAELFPNLQAFNIQAVTSDESDNKENSGSPLQRETGDETSPAKRPKYDFDKEEDYVVVYTDGACENNGRAGAKAGIGVWFGENHALNVSKPVKGKATNNVAEIQACISAVQLAREQGIKKLKICTDSQFTINAMTKWIHNWKKNNWTSSKGDLVKNKDDFEVLDQLCAGLDVKWRHVAGHKGIKGNECADRLAREGAKLYVR